MNPRTRAIPLLIAAALAVTVVAPASAARPIVVKIATAAPEGTVWHKGLERMAEDWQNGTDGRVTARIYAGGVAGDEPDAIRKMRLGQIQAVSVSIIGLSSINNSFDVFSIPLFYDSYDELYQVMDALEPTMEQRLDERGFVLLGWGFGGWVHVFTKQPVRRFDDLKKVKMFVSAGNDAWVRYWQKSGFHPVPLATTDIMTGLETGLIDGLPSTPLAALSLQWFRQAPNMLDLGLAPLVGATLVTKKTWERIDPADRKVMIEAARRLERTLKEEVPQQDADAVVEMKKRGLTVTEPDPDDPGWRAEADKLSRSIRGTMVENEVYEKAVRARQAYRDSAAGDGGGH